EAAWQLDVDGDVLIGVKFGREVALFGRIIDDVVVKVTPGFHHVDIKLALYSRLGKYVRVITFLKRVVGDVLNDCRGLFIIYKTGSLYYKLLGVYFELSEYALINTGEYLNYS